jgi:hypothetical protein
MTPAEYLFMQERREHLADAQRRWRVRQFFRSNRWELQVLAVYAGLIAAGTVLLVHVLRIP